MEQTIVHNQTTRHIINVPVPFTREQLTVLVRHYSGFEDQPEMVENYVDQVIQYGELDLNPSSALGFGADIVDTFNFGFMAYMKLYFNIDINPEMLWFHPCSSRIPVKIESIVIKDAPVTIESNENVMYFARLAGTDEIVSADRIAGKCPGNSDNLSSYFDNGFDDDGDELPF